MLNSKLEKVIGGIVWYVFLIVFQLILPSSSPLSFKDLPGLLVLSCGVSYIYFSIYFHFRNKHFKKKVSLYLDQNQFDACVTYVEKCLKGHKKSPWLKLEKANMLAMSGRIEEFYDFIATIKNDEKITKKFHYDFIQDFEIVFSFLKKDNAVQLPKANCQDNSCLGKIAEIIQSVNNTEKNDVIPKALSIYNTKHALYKSVIALILAEQYEKNGDTANVQTYVADAKKYAPSAEVLYYLTKHEVVSSVE